MMHGAIEAAYLLGDAGVAARAYELLSPHAELPMVASLGVACFGSAHHALGTAAATFGDLDTAIAHLDKAVRGNLALNHWPALTASRLRYAHLLEQRGLPDDHSAARAQRAAASADVETAEPSAAADAPAEPASCTREGQLWRVGWGGRSVTVRHSIGLLYLAVLVNNPGQDVPSLDLVAGLDLVSAAYGAVGSPQPMLDRAAITQYRERLSELTAQIEEHLAHGNRDAADRARVEHDWLVGELSAATGIGGQTRNFPDGAERARTAVAKAVRRVLARITEADPEIGDHLRQSVRTGLVCSYRPTHQA